MVAGSDGDTSSARGSKVEETSNQGRLVSIKIETGE